MKRSSTCAINVKNDKNPQRNSGSRKCLRFGVFSQQFLVRQVFQCFRFDGLVYSGCVVGPVFASKEVSLDSFSKK